MTPAERVGQLFIVSFYGANAAAESDIYQLITQYHVGGVILSAANDNITDTVNAPAQVLTLTNELQAAAVTAATLPREGDPPDGSTPPYVPLLIAANHEGDGDPFTEIRSGMTALPSAMAIGATWDPGQAEAMGRITGAELAALGINLLIGPSLDVLETPRPDGKDLGTRVFGGDPYWVGRMGQAYITGVHGGSGNQVAVVAKHFPGHGGSDRGPDVELPTVRKSFEDLQSFDLVPFYAVTGRAPDTAAVADGLLTAHIRFQGFQGDIRQNTQPMSFDPAALGQLLGLTEIANWRGNGGVMVSDSLGAQAIKSFNDPTLQEFNHRGIARNAFYAGNDLLLLSDFGLNPRVDQTSRIIETLAYFAQNYQADPNFAARVDDAVRRILTLKLRLSGGAFEAQAALRPATGLDRLNNGATSVVRLAQAAAALISPTASELVARAPDAPTPSQRLVFFTDTRTSTQCSTCQRYSLLDKRQLELEVLSLFGPNGSEQARASNLQSYSFDELAAYLENPVPPAVGEQTPTPAPSPVEAALLQADWIVFSMLNVTADVPSSGVVSTFLAQRPDLVRSKKIIVFAFNAPYYLDTTDLSKLTAYYALYSRTPAFVTTAARILYRDLSPTAAPPVSVAGVGYNLIDRTRPDPAQIIQLSCQDSVAAEGAAPCAELRLNDTITVTISALKDHNGHTVPDETPVTFTLLYTELGLPDTLVVPTVNGVAEIPLQLNRPGPLEITASSDPAHVSTTIQINVQPDESFGITPVVPTTAPTDTPEPTNTQPPPTATATVTPAPTATLEPEPTVVPVDMRAFFVMCLGLAAVLLSGYRLGTLEDPQTRYGVRVALAGAIGLLLGYNYVALSLPGSDVLYLWLTVFAAPVSAIMGGILGLAAGWYWFVGRNLPS